MSDTTEIHKPRLPATWKKFLIELATVVLGILIALSLDQAVGNWREHREYLEAREAMRFELASNLASLGRRDAISACARQRIVQIGAMLDKAEKNQGFDPPTLIGQASSARLRFAAETEAGRSGLFSPAEQRLFARPYSFLHSIDLEQDRERQAWARLRMLEGRSSATPEMIANLREALAQARYQDERIQFLFGFFKAANDEMSLTAVPINAEFWPQAWPHCLPLDTSPAEAARRSAYGPLRVPGGG